MKKFDRKKPKAEHIINNSIRFPKMFLIDSEGNKLGLKTREEALNLANEEGLDLVIISNNPKQPVAKILDYGKFKYDRKKKQKEVKAKLSVINNREVRLTPMIGIHDLETKAKKAREFINNGDRVKVSLKFRGRERSRQELGYEKLNQFFVYLEDVAQIEKEPKLNGGRFLDMYLIKSKINKKNNIQEKQQKEIKEEENQDAKN